MDGQIRPATPDDKTLEQADLEQVAEDASDWFQTIGRAGWVAKGVVYTLIGVLFMQIGFAPDGSGEANQAGAIEAIAERSLGQILLVAVGLGLLLYTVWRLFTAFLPGDWTGRALLDRLGYLVSAIIYSTLLAKIVGALRTASSSVDTREDQKIEDIVKDVLAVTAGRTMVIVGGTVVVIIGLVFCRKGWTRSFRDQISGDDGIEGTLIDRLGTIGWIARGVSMILIGFFLIRAAWLFDSDEAAGLDDSMRQIASHPIGAVLTVVVGLGFVAYGIFAGISSRHRVLEGPRND